MTTCPQGRAVEWALYVAGTLPEPARRELEAHLAGCAACREELALWRMVGAQVRAESAMLPLPPQRVLLEAQARARRSRQSVLVRAWALLGAQAALVRRELWVASALVMGLGALLALLSHQGALVLEVFAPLVAAAGLASIYGPENDPGLELTLATPTSPRQVLLARMALVFGYDLVPALAASVLLILAGQPGPLGALILSWLAPMAFLSALALLLSLCIGTANAVAGAFGLWLAYRLGATAAIESRYGVPLAEVLRLYAAAWQAPGMLLAMAAVLLAATLWLAGRQERLLMQHA